MTCRAIQHAHLNGIIHRDIKPSNVMVTEVDGEPRPRIIDFGIAKATNRSEAELTMFTSERQLLGTPEYMSPEQVETWGADVDARTDVYSLSVVFYELLCGSRPFDLRRSRSRLHGEILRQIKDEEPDKPSARVLSLGHAEAAKVAKLRSTDPKALVRGLRRELDWISMRGLEKDPEQRYSTPVGLAKDVDRFLHGDPVEAGPRSAVYRVRKFALRHRKSFIAAALVMLSLVVGTIFAVYGLLEAREQADLARSAELHARASEVAERAERERAEIGEEKARIEAEKVQAALFAIEDLLGAADPRRNHRAGYTVREMLDQFDHDLAGMSIKDPEVEARLRSVLGMTFRQLGELDRAEVHLRKARDLRVGSSETEPGVLMDTRFDWAWLLHDRARFEEALAEMDVVIQYWREQVAVGEEAAIPELAGALDARSTFLGQLNRLDEALVASHEALELGVEAMGRDHPDNARTLSRYAHLLLFAGRLREGETALREALEILDGHLSPGHPEVLTLKQNLAVMLTQLGRRKEAETMFWEILEGRLALYGEDHPDIAQTRMNLGWLCHKRHAYAQAVELLSLARDGLVDAYGENHPIVTEATNRLGVATEHFGDVSGAELLLREAVRRYRTLPGHRIDAHVACWSNLGILLMELGRFEEAEVELRGALELGRSQLPDPHPSTVAAMINYAGVLENMGDPEAALELLDEAMEDGLQVWSEEHPTLEYLRRHREKLESRK